MRRYVKSAGLLAAVACFVAPAAAGPPDPPGPASRHSGIHIELDRDFYEALRSGDGTEGGRVYSTDLSREYLRRIAVASEFAVKTNLEILRRQEEIIRLLADLGQGRGQGVGRRIEDAAPVSPGVSMSGSGHVVDQGRSPCPCASRGAGEKEPCSQEGRSPGDR